MSASKELDSFGDREIRDIASQIMVRTEFGTSWMVLQKPSLPNLQACVW